MQRFPWTSSGDVDDDQDMARAWIACVVVDYNDDGPRSVAIILDTLMVAGASMLIVGPESSMATLRRAATMLADFDPLSVGVVESWRLDRLVNLKLKPGRLT